MIHLGDTFYFYDHMTDIPVENFKSMHAAHVSMRRHIEFLNMAREVPCCGIWDDHDFAGDDKDSTSIPASRRDDAVNTWRQYWGNQPLDPKHDNLGLSTRISYGSVDIYLLDSRYYRNFDKGVFFGNEIISRVLAEIDDRARGPIGAESIPRVVVLATGSNWTHRYDEDPENYGASEYKNEREDFFKELANRMGTSINGLALLSGDNHYNEIFHVNLGNGRMAPEFSSSPFTLNTDLEDSRPIAGERVAFFPTGGSNGKRGFATLTIQPSPDTRDNWRATVWYYQEAYAAPYASRTYVTSNGQFVSI